MPRRIGNTLVPRNPVAQVASNRCSGAHQRGRTAERQESRAQVRKFTDDWREELAFELEVRVDRDADRG